MKAFFAFALSSGCGARGFQLDDAVTHGLALGGCSPSPSIATAGGMMLLSKGPD
jgi:hypothetical protein